MQLEWNGHIDETKFVAVNEAGPRWDLVQLESDSGARIHAISLIESHADFEIYYTIAFKLQDEYDA